LLYSRSTLQPSISMLWSAVIELLIKNNAIARLLELASP
jgi:hypothetical protein